MGITTITRASVKWNNSSSNQKTWRRPSFSTISTIVNEQQSLTVITNKVEEEVEEVKVLDQCKPRFRMFSNKKTNLTELNNKCLEEDNKAIKEKQKSSKNGKKAVCFNPICLERVCLFLEAQSPCQLKEAHDKHLLNPPFRMIYSHWPASKTLILDKKHFSITSDNSHIYGKVMVPNLTLDKSVLIRYTFDSWATINDVDATFFSPYFKNTDYDIYEFTMNLQLADRGEIRGKLEFTIRFTIGSIDYWDDNYYQIKIICDPLNKPQDEDYSTEEEEENHQQFKSALKDYQHAKPCWLLGTRYDFTESLFYSPPPSPKLVSPSLEFNSSLYLSLLKNYCFYYTSDHLL